jgi:hypothetical protein
MYTVTSLDGAAVQISTLSPGGAAKKAVEEFALPAGRLVVVDEETGVQTVWQVNVQRIVYAREVRDE